MVTWYKLVLVVWCKPSSETQGQLVGSIKCSWWKFTVRSRRAPGHLLGAIHSTKIPTGPTGKRGPPQKVDPFFRNFPAWTEPIHWVLDRNFRKVWLNGSRPLLPNQFQKRLNCLLLIGQKNFFLANQRREAAGWLSCFLTRRSFLHRSP